MTGRVDDYPIQDRIAGVSFSFYTDQEAKKLSVQQIIDPVAFDHLNNPTKQGLHDKKMGVSPFDHKSACTTCGMTVNYCPGHVGHIELTATIYNPFLFKDIYKLLKAKCFACHRMRIHGSKQEAFIGALKLIKAGDVVHSQELKSFLLYAAKAITLFPDQGLGDVKRMLAFKSSIEKQGKGHFKLNVDNVDLPNFISKLENAINERKENYEQHLKDIFSDVVKGDVELVSTTTSQRALLDLTKEIWGAVVTTTCPHCKHKSPAVKKDGYTKLFIKPLQGQSAVAARQNKNIQGSKGGSKSRDSSGGEFRDGFEVITNASTNNSRRPSGSATTEIEDSIAGQGEDEEGVQSSEDEEFKEGTPQKYITPIEVQDHLRKLWAKEGALLNLLYGRFNINSEDHAESMGFEQFFMKTVIVPPTRFRPESEGNMGTPSDGDRAYLHTHSAMLTKVIQCNISLSEALVQQVNPEAQLNSVKPVYGSATQKWIMLQDAVNTFMDASMAGKTADKQQQGIRQLLERKEGMFRMKMMGKRVNFGGRSVISPDPMITTDQIGVPIFMAKKLTFPESVSAINAVRLARLIKNGSDVHPGANIVEDEITGKQILLSNMTRDERDGVANQIQVGRKIVHRHLTHGDVLIVNRQPTLHKPSMMTHIARILPKEQTLRFHYANCSTYNADFDGDEMNIHLPQSYPAIAEAYELMATHKQYVVPTSGKPLRGLIQDSVVGGVLMTSKDTFLTKEEYMQMVYVGLQELLADNKLSRIYTMPPQIIKPKPLWTGKQVISTLLKNIVLSGKSAKEVKEIQKVCGMNLESKSRLNAKEWGPLGKEEGEVIIRDNEHLQGTLDKNQFGANDHGMVHSFYEVYGSKKAGELLTSLARIFFIFLQIHGFTVGLDDLALQQGCNKRRRLLIEQGHMNGMIAAAKFAEMPKYNIQKLNYSNRVVYQSEKRMDKEIENYNQMVIPSDPFSNQKKCIQADDPIRACLEAKIGQATAANKEHLEAEFDNVIKGCMSSATTAILNNCIPMGLIKRFPKNNISTMCLTGAKGGIVNQTQISALLGQQELEGRRVPRMQNGRTLPCYLSYDPNPRSSGYVSDRFFTGLRPQDFFFHCMAGREGLIDTAVKTSRSGYLQRCLIKQLESLVVSYDLTVRDNDGSIVQFLYGDDGVDVMENKFLDKFQFLENNHNTCFRNIDKFLKSGAVDIEPVEQAKLQMRRDTKRIMKQNPQLTEKQAQIQVDPILSKFHPQRNFGSISEKMETTIQQHIQTKTLSASRLKEGDRALKYRYPIVEPEALKKMYYYKYLKSLVNAGENVGTIAAQSIGEPSTQMTLNTFHLAGHGAANMTLGIPRLKEILMTTPTNIKTPCMQVPFRRDIGLTIEQMTQISNSFERIKFSDVVKNVKLCQAIERNVDGNYSRIYKLTLQFENAKQLKQKLGISFNHLCKVFSDNFVPQLMNETLKELRRAAEMDLSGNKNEANQDQLKKVLSKTVKATKVARGTTEAPKEEGAPVEEEDVQMEDVKEEQSEQDSDKDEAEQLMDIDGFQKSKVTSYGNSDSEMEHQQNGNEAENEEAESDDHQKDSKLQKDMETHSRILREKHSKYLQYLKGDFEFESHKSATVTLQFPLEYKKLLMLSLAETVVKKVVVRSVAGVDRCTLILPKQDKDPYLFVQGLSFEAFEKHDKFFQLDKIQSNHSYAMKLKYGIEACRANIVNEIKAVFDVYGIAVDSRHLSLISDFITYNGDYRAFNRIGMEESNSPFLKMSYETTMKYLIQSSVSKETDWMNSPSSALVLGQVPAVGTGCFDLIQC